MRTQVKKTIKNSLRILLTPIYKRLANPEPFNFPPCIYVQSPEDTLRECKNLIENRVRGAYLRFGDGDVYLLTNRSEKLQETNCKLQMEMMEAFSLGGNGIVKGLPLHSPRFGIFPGMAPGIHGASDEWAIELLTHCYPYYIGNKIYSNVALSYLAVYNESFCLDFLGFLKSKSPALFIGNENIPASVINALFGNPVCIKTPPSNSYDAIDRVYQEVQENLLDGNEFNTAIVCMGCSGRVLIKRILNSGANIFLFDFGSLMDALCGWKTREWIELCNFDAEDFLDKMSRL